MASKIIGRTSCPVRCGNDAAHVKIKTDKEAGKEAYPYIHCPGCGQQLHTKNQEQAEYLLAITRPEKLDLPAQEPEPNKPPVKIAVAPPEPPVAPRGGMSRAWRQS